MIFIGGTDTKSNLKKKLLIKQISFEKLYFIYQ